MLPVDVIRLAPRTVIKVFQNPNTHLIFDIQTKTKMWPLFIRALTRYAPYITIPVAGVVGYIGYHLEDLVSDKYTPFSESIEEKRRARQSTEESLKNATNVEALKYQADVFGKNISPSLKPS